MAACFVVAALLHQALGGYRPVLTWAGLAALAALAAAAVLAAGRR